MVSADLQSNPKSMVEGENVLVRRDWCKGRSFGDLREQHASEFRRVQQCRQEREEGELTYRKTSGVFEHPRHPNSAHTAEGGGLEGNKPLGHAAKGGEGMSWRKSQDGAEDAVKSGCMSREAVCA